MTIDTEDDLRGLKVIGAIVAGCLRHMGQSLAPGMSTRELDEIGRAYLEEHGALSAPEATYKFPGTTCISVNEEIAHGIPGRRIINAGDMVNIDVSAIKHGYVGDTGGSFIIPPESKIQRRLIEATQATLAAAIAVARAGQPIRAIGGAIESTAKKHGFKIIRNLGSHGVGRSLHEDPEFIAPYYDANDRRLLKEGMVITIEPFLSTKAVEAVESADGWTLGTNKGTWTAQFEHSMVITRGNPIILTA